MTRDMNAEIHLKQFQQKFGATGKTMLDLACHAALPVDKIKNWGNSDIDFEDSV